MPGKMVNGIFFKGSLQVVSVEHVKLSVLVTQETSGWYQLRTLQTRFENNHPLPTKGHTGE